MTDRNEDLDKPLMTVLDGEPVLAYTANGNLEAHSVVTWLESCGVRSYAVEDNSWVSVFALGTISQFLKPQVFVAKSDLQRAGELLRQFERQRDQRRTKIKDAPPIISQCEECGDSSEFPSFARWHDAKLPPVSRVHRCRNARLAR